MIMEKESQVVQLEKMNILKGWILKTSGTVIYSEN
jgi:hypothetical protein